MTARAMSLAEFCYLVRSDVWRVAGGGGARTLLRHVLFGEAFQFIFWMRACRFLRAHRALKYSLYPFARWMYTRCKYKYGIAISFDTEIGPGFYIGHFGGIVVHPHTRIGKNCNLSHGVTLGKANRGRRAGAPVIGDHVYLGPGAKIIGAVTVGNFAAVGANCVVTHDVPACGVVVGVPGRVISCAGSYGYVENTDYPAR